MKFATTKNLIVIGVFAGICFIAGIFSAGPATSWIGIVPPLLAISLAIISGRIIVSLALAVLAGGFLVSVPDDPLSPIAWVGGPVQALRFFASAVGVGWASGDGTDGSGLAIDWEPFQILSFVALILVMIAIMIAAGGLHGIVMGLSRLVIGPRSAQFVTALTGLIIFIDDYANTMIVGSAMRPVTDKHRISREKLAFLVDATSAPIAGLAIVSTWIGYEVGLFGSAAESLGIARDGYAMFFDALPFRFYCILMIVFVLANTVSGVDFGPMRRAQERAAATGALAAADARAISSAGFQKAEMSSVAVPRPRTAVIPLATFFMFLLGGIWLEGDGWEKLAGSPLSLFSPAAWGEAISGSNSIPLLAGAAVAGAACAVVTAILFGRLPLPHIGRAAIAGLRNSGLPVLILALAWALKETCDALNAGPFLVSAIGQTLSPLWFPALVFVVASATSFAIGTSYGTMAILIPTAVPMAFSLDGGVYGLATIITLGAILDGAIFGDHCSPLSDTTIMSSISSSCDHLHHVRTQLPYSLFVAALALVCGYVPAALGLPAWISLLAGAAVLLLLFWSLRRRANG